MKYEINKAERRVVSILNNLASCVTLTPAAPETFAFLNCFVTVYGRSLNLTVTANSGLTLHLSWEFAEDNPNFGSFQGYQILYSTGNDIIEDLLLAMEINDNITQAWFVGEACEFYSFKVRAYSLEGYGKLSEAVSMVTACEGKCIWFIFLTLNQIQRNQHKIPKYC